MYSGNMRTLFSKRRSLNIGKKKNGRGSFTLRRWSDRSCNRCGGGGEGDDDWRSRKGASSVRFNDCPISIEPEQQSGEKLTGAASSFSSGSSDDCTSSPPQIDRTVRWYKEADYHRFAEDIKLSVEYFMLCRCSDAGKKVDEETKVPDDSSYEDDAQLCSLGLENWILAALRKELAFSGKGASSWASSYDYLYHRSMKKLVVETAIIEQNFFSANNLAERLQPMSEQSIQDAIERARKNYERNNQSIYVGEVDYGAGMDGFGAEEPPATLESAAALLTNTGSALDDNQMKHYESALPSPFQLSTTQAFTARVA